MTIIDRLEREAKRRPSATGEGVRIALEVLRECRCETCRHCDTEEAADTFGYCQKHGGAARMHEEFCSRWEERT